jgi:hypothetical protein
MNGRNRFEELGAHGRIILKRALKKYGVRVYTGFTWLRTGCDNGLFVNTIMDLQFP